MPNRSQCRRKKTVTLTPLLDAKATADFLNVDRRTLSRIVESGALVAIRLPISGALRFRQNTLNTFVQGLQTKATAAA